VRGIFSADILGISQRVQEKPLGSCEAQVLSLRAELVCSSALVSAALGCHLFELGGDCTQTFPLEEDGQC